MAAAEAGKPTTNPTNESGRKPKSMLTPFGYAESCAEQQPANVLMICHVLQAHREAKTGPFAEPPQKFEFPEWSVTA